MKFGKRAGLAVLASAYIASSYLAFRHDAKADDPARETIRIAHWQLETGVRQAIDAIIRRYEQINPRVHVVQIAVPGGPIYTSWVLTQMAGNTAPDLVQYDPSYPDVARDFQPISADIMKPNPYNRGTPLAGVRWRDTFIDGMTTTGFDPNLHDYYSVSMDTHLGRIVYNRPLLKAITGRDAPPRTYRELLALCDRVRAYARDHRLNLVPMANSKESVQLQCWLIAVTLTNGLCERIDYQHRLVVGAGDLGRSYLRGDWSYDSPEAVAALHEIKEFGDMCTPGFWARERDEAVTDFVGGRAVMFVAPSYEATNLLSLCPFPIAAFAYPYPLEDDPVYGRYARGPFSEGQVITGMPFYVNRLTPHRAEAIDFLEFMTSQEGSTIFTQLSNWPPATIGVKPSAFASQFKLQTEGYNWGGNILVPTIEGDARNFVVSNFAELWEADGSVDAYRRVLRDGIAGKIRDDLRREIESGLDNLRRMDIEAAARVELDPPARRPEVLPILAASNEGLLYQTRDILESSPKPSAPSPGDITAAPEPPGAPAPGGTPARQAYFGRGLSLLDDQPVSPEHVEEARRTFRALADSGGDDAAQGARFFLGRIAQYHQEVPDPAEAARQYSRLIAEHPRSLWAQTALARLALLEIYALDAQLPPEARIARAGRLLACAVTPAARSDLHFAVAYAIFHYRLPAAEALPHLLATEQLDRLDWIDRREVLVQIAELSRLAGEKSQAARYYRIFLDEYPIDTRDYLVRQRLAAMERG